MDRLTDKVEELQHNDEQLKRSDEELKRSDEELKRSGKEQAIICSIGYSNSSMCVCKNKKLLCCFEVVYNKINCFVV